MTRDPSGTPSADPGAGADLAGFVARGGLAGAVTVVADRDGVRDLRAVGWADAPARVAMREDALFWIASMTKPVTATALMLLVDEGLVDLEAPVERWLPGF